MSSRPLAWLPPMLLVLTVGSPALAQSPGRRCRTACAAANVPASCAWLATRPGRCRRAALRACKQAVRRGGPVACEAPADLAACLTNHSCPFGALCVDGRCQVVACTTAVDCPPDAACRDGRCLVTDCRASDQNCPRSAVCVPAPPPFAEISGTCRAADPRRVACLSNADCRDTPSPRCRHGVCAKRVTGHRCEGDGDCFEACKRGARAVRIPRCDATGRCVCANCADDAQCAARFGCTAGPEPVCRPKGTCVCPPAGGGGPRGVCTSFETPPCTSCTTDADCLGVDRCLQSASCG